MSPFFLKKTVFLNAIFGCFNNERACYENNGAKLQKNYVLAYHGATND